MFVFASGRIGSVSIRCHTPGSMFPWWESVSECLTICVIKCEIYFLKRVFLVCYNLSRDSLYSHCSNIKHRLPSFVNLHSLSYSGILATISTQHNYSDVTWAMWLFKSTATRLCVPIRANGKIIIKAPHYWSFVKRIHWWPMRSLTEDQ